MLVIGRLVLIFFISSGFFFHLNLQILKQLAQAGREDRVFLVSLAEDLAQAELFQAGRLACLLNHLMVLRLRQVSARVWLHELRLRRVYAGVERDRFIVVRQRGRRSNLNVRSASLYIVLDHRT